jgi:hypothetical protein
VKRAPDPRRRRRPRGICDKCGGRVIDAVMQLSGVAIELDPQPTDHGNLQLFEPGAQAQYIAPEYREPTSRWFVPPEQRFQLHRTTCPAEQSVDA